MLSLLLKGLIIGFSIAAPVGPIGVLCINRSLHDGWRIGMATGIGAAAADGIYGVIAGFGLTFISSFMLNHSWWIKLIGGLFLLYLGGKTLLSRPPKQLTLTHANSSLARAFITTFFLTLTNPMTILSFTAVFAGLGLGSVSTSYAEAGILVAGIVAGSALWWLLLSAGVAMIFRNRINRSILSWANFASGFIIIVFGIVSLLSMTR